MSDHVYNEVRRIRKRIGQPTDSPDRLGSVMARLAAIEDKVVPRVLYTKTEGAASSVPNALTSKYNCFQAFVNGKFYTLKGYDTSVSSQSAKSEVYDPVTGLWTALPAAQYGSEGGSTAVFNGVIYCITGVGVTGLVEAFDTATNAWSRKADAVHRNKAAAGVSNGKVYRAGGDLSSVKYGDCSEYDPATNTWNNSKASAPGIIGSSPSYWEYGGELWVAGGTTDAGTPRTMYSYNGATNLWTTRAVPPDAYLGSACLLVGQDAWLFWGGSSKYVRVYHHATNTWEPTTSHPVGTDGYNFPWSCRPFYIDGKFNFVHGESGGSNIARAYDPALEYPQDVLLSEDNVLIKPYGMSAGAWYLVFGDGSSLMNGSDNTEYGPYPGPVSLRLRGEKVSWRGYPVRLWMY